MSPTGVRVSPRLAHIAGGFFLLVIVTFIIWPWFHKPKASPKPMPAITHVPINIPSSNPIISQATPKASPTPCQACLDVLSRYLHAIHTGAGGQNEALR